MTRLQRLVVAFNERHHSLVTDGYLDSFSTDLLNGKYIRMAHANGNSVSLAIYYDDYRIIQRTNGKVVHDEEVC